MYLSRCLIYLSLVFPLLANAQQLNGNYRDSLENIVATSANDSIKARASFLLSDELSYADTISAMRFLRLGIEFSDGNKYLQALAVYYNGLLVFDSRTPIAEKLLLQSDSLLSPFKTSEAYLFRSRCWRNYGALRLNANDPETSLTVLVEKAIPFAIKSGDKEYLAKNYADVGLVFMNRWQYDKAASYYDKALKLLQTTKQKSANLVVYINAIRNFLYMNKYKEAKQLIEEIKNLIEPSTIDEIDFLLNEGIYFVGTVQYENALTALDKALKTAMKLGNAVLAESIRFQQYRAYAGLGRYSKAIDILLFMVKNPARHSDQNKLEQYHELAATYAKQDNMKLAYHWQREYSDFLDTVSKRQLNNEINALEIKFHNAENQTKIAELNIANQQANLSAKNSRLISWLFGAVSLFLLTAAILILFFFRNYKRSLIQQAQIENTKMIMQAQEEERSRVARDLHDGLGGMITTAKLNLEDFAQGNKFVANSKPNAIIDQLNNCISELRRIARNMMPEMLLKLGLEASLKDLCKALTTKYFHIDFQFLDIRDSISMETKIIIYRIVQELLTNVVKHAHAENVMLQCAQHDQLFFITVEDDGKGFDTNQLAYVQGIGLNNIKSRVAYLQGKIDIVSKPQQGTAINIELNVST